MLLIVAPAAALAVLAVTFTVVPIANAGPGSPAPCVTPSGESCAPAQAGCVDPDNSLPCSSSLPDINAALRKELNSVLGGGLPSGGG
jgi:hypothetical protein